MPNLAHLACSAEARAKWAPPLCSFTGVPVQRPPPPSLANRSGSTEPCVDPPLAFPGGAPASPALGALGTVPVQSGGAPASPALAVLGSVFVQWVPLPTPAGCFPSTQPPPELALGSSGPASSVSSTSRRSLASGTGPPLSASCAEEQPFSLSTDAPSTAGLCLPTARPSAPVSWTGTRPPASHPGSPLSLSSPIERHLCPCTYPSSPGPVSSVSGTNERSAPGSPPEPRPPDLGPVHPSVLWSAASSQGPSSSLSSWREQPGPNSRCDLSPLPPFEPQSVASSQEQTSSSTCPTPSWKRVRRSSPPSDASRERLMPLVPGVYPGCASLRSGR